MLRFAFRLKVFIDLQSKTTSLIPSQSVPVRCSLSDPPSPSRPLTACDAKALLLGQAPGAEASPGVLAGIDVRRGQGAVTLEDGRQMELKTVSVETRHVLEFEERELPTESSGQLHEGESYVIRWTYSLRSQGAWL